MLNFLLFVKHEANDIKWVGEITDAGSFTGARS